MRLAPFAAAVIALSWLGCNTRPQLPSKPVGAAVAITAPLGLPPVPASPSNPPTAETIALGEKLFFSTALSVDGTVSCASCHNPKKGFADDRAISPGVSGKLGNRNAPTVANAAYNALQFWDGRAADLEAQAAGPMMNPVEMAHSIEGVEKRCAEDPALRKMFEAAYGPAPEGTSPVTLARVTNAIAAYERTILRANSPFDRFFYGNDKTALSKSAQIGLNVFLKKDKGNCVACHTVGEQYALFTDNKFHNLGTGLNAEGELIDLGRYNVTKVESDKGAFRTPSLRNVAQTAPYMHDGSLKELKDVVDFYVGGGSSNPYRDELIQPLTHLTREEREGLVAFLESLTGEPR